MSIIRKRNVIERVVEPTLEGEMSEIVKEVKQYAPPQHSDRVDASAEIMCEQVEKIYTNTADGLDACVSELRDMVDKLESGVEAFKGGVREAADHLKDQIRTITSRCADIAGKLQESPFNGHLPKFLGKDDGEAEKE